MVGLQGFFTAFINGKGFRFSAEMEITGNDPLIKLFEKIVRFQTLQVTVNGRPVFFLLFPTAARLLDQAEKFSPQPFAERHGPVLPVIVQKRTLVEAEDFFKGRAALVIGICFNRRFESPGIHPYKSPAEGDGPIPVLNCFFPLKQIAQTDKRDFKSPVRGVAVRVRPQNVAEPGLAHLAVESDQGLQQVERFLRNFPGKAHGFVVAQHLEPAERADFHRPGPRFLRQCR